MRKALIPEEPKLAALLVEVRRLLETMFDVTATVEVGAAGEYWRLDLNHLGLSDVALRAQWGMYNEACIVVVPPWKIEHQLRGPWGHHDDAMPKPVLDRQLVVYEHHDNRDWLGKVFCHSFSLPSREQT